VKRALEAGKHVLCEKSLTGDESQSRELVRLAREQDLVLVENFMCGNHPQHQVVRNLVTSKEIGELRHLWLNFGFPPFPRDDQRNSAELAGGALNDAGAYCVFMSSFYTGMVPVRISGALWAADYPVDVKGTVSFYYPNGVTADLNFGFVFDYLNSISLWGSEGQITIDRAFSIPPDRLPDISLVKNTQRKSIDAPAANHFVLQLERFSRLIDSAEERHDEYRRTEVQAALMGSIRQASLRGSDVDFEFQF
jgi:predicted dehydrogenase